MCSKYVSTFCAIFNTRMPNADAFLTAVNSAAQKALVAKFGKA